MRISIFQPDIPQNLGALLRISACLDVPVDIIEPCGFPFSEKKFKSVLKNNYLTEDEYLSKLQTELLNDKMLGPIKNFKVYNLRKSYKIFYCAHMNVRCVIAIMR